MKNTVQQYLDKFSYTGQLIHVPPKPGTELIIVIPCHDEPSLITSVKALFNCTPPHCHVEVIIVINASENDDKSIIHQNLCSKKELMEFDEENKLDWFDLHVIEENNLPKKNAGVGLARKIGMDEAVRRFHTLERDGIISCFDADSQCDKNYLTELFRHFRKNENSPACSLYFEHPLKGNEFPEEIYRGIKRYELHLRYYKQGLSFCDYPFPFHTVGSSMAVKTVAYCKVGGMNKRKAGEDFYFLQKLMLRGNYSELNTTRVIPSPRPSNRVPFGTGKAITDWLENSENAYMTYHPDTFLLLRPLFSKAELLFQSENPFKTLSASPVVESFLKSSGFLDQIEGMQNKSKNKDQFLKHFYTWFNRFTVLKLIHYIRDNELGEMEVAEAAYKLLEMTGRNPGGKEADSLLMDYRRINSVEGN